MRWFWYVFGELGDGEKALRECAARLALDDNTSVDDSMRTIEFDMDDYNGGYIVTAYLPDGDEFAFTASDYKDVFYYINRITDRLELYYQLCYQMVYPSRFIDETTRFRGNLIVNNFND